MKKTISMLLASALVLLSLTSCSGENNTAEGTSSGSGSENTAAPAVSDPDPAVEASYKPTEDNVKPLGRTFYVDETLYCALSGTGVEFTFTGTQCSITVQGDSGSTSSSNADNQARVAVYVNGERVIDDMVDNAEEVYNVFESDTEKEVTVSLVKLSESANSTIGIKEIKATGTAIKPTPNKDMLIEFVGDSITCGYGVDDPDKNHHFSTKTEDVTKAYGYLTAQKLNADYSMVSFSGYGIISGYSGDGKKVAAQIVPPLYDKLGTTWTSNGTFAPSYEEWDFSKRQPDVVVINLGTNDDSYTKDDTGLQEEYCTAYTEFLKTVREKNPDAKILCVFGVMGDRLFPYVEKAVENYTSETGDSNVSALRLSPQSARDGYGADWHPSEVTHGKVADKVAEEINKILS